MEQKKDLQTSKRSISQAEGISSLIQIRKEEDLLKAVPIVQQIRNHGENSVLVEIRLAIEKCSYKLDFDVDDHHVKMLCYDILEVYGNDSIEDIQQCLKKAGQGKYGFGFNRRGKITMILVREWMSKHLEEKARVIEKFHQNQKHENEIEERPTPASPEKAREYIQKLKEMFKAAEKKGSTSKPVIDHSNTEGGWMKVIKADPGLSAVYDHICQKFENDEELTEKEITWMEEWKVPIKISKS